MTEPAASPAPNLNTAAPHWVLPFAASLSEPCQYALRELAKAEALPHLRQLLGSMQAIRRLEGDEYALSMPHERVLAIEMGWASNEGVEDGLMPWAAWWAARDGVPLDPSRHWGMLSPGHWLMGRDHLTLLDPQTQGLTDDESHALLEAVRELFESDGWTLQWGAATRWYAAHDSLTGLPTAALDRVIGRNPDVWLTKHPQARMLRRLQSEVQMLLYEHPINDAREARGQATVNSFWLSGCGLPPATLQWPASTRLVDDLRAPLLSDDMQVWLEAWAHVDGTVLRTLVDAAHSGQPVQLTLCGERHAVTLSSAPDVMNAKAARAGFGARLRQSLQRLTGKGTHTSSPDPAAFLEAL